MVIMHPLYKDYDDLSAKYNLLQLPVKIGDVFSIKGKLPIIDCNGTVWDTFSVRIDVHIDYPGSLPTITETEKRIPRNGKWHINPDDSCCVGTTAEQYQKLHGKLNVLNWVNEFAIPFFANYLYKKEKGHYVNGEWSHREEGEYEYYAHLYGITNLQNLIRYLRLCSGSEKLNLNNPCFCNSGKKYKRCYLLYPDQHRHNIPKRIVYENALQLQEFQKTFKGKVDL